MIDTANNYGNSEKLISSLKINNLKIISKISGFKNDKIALKKYISSIIGNLFNIFGNSKIYAIMFHDAEEILNLEKFRIFD